MLNNTLYVSTVARNGERFPGDLQRRVARRPARGQVLSHGAVRPQPVLPALHQVHW